MHISKQGVDLIKKYEAFSPISYSCSAGRKTIGFGHVINRSDQFQTSITLPEAEELLRKDLIIVEAYINSAVRANLSQGRFDALCSLVFNCGCGAFGKSKGLVALNKENYRNAADEFFSVDKGFIHVKGKFSNGLYKRRQAELELWND